MWTFTKLNQVLMFRILNDKTTEAPIANSSGD